MKNVFKVMLILATVYCTQSLAEMRDVTIRDSSNQHTQRLELDSNITNNQFYQAVSDSLGQPVDRMKLILNGRQIIKNDDNIDPQAFSVGHVIMSLTREASPLPEQERTQRMIEEKEFEVAELKLKLDYETRNREAYCGCRA